MVCGVWWCVLEWCVWWCMRCVVVCGGGVVCGVVCDGVVSGWCVVMVQEAVWQSLIHVQYSYTITTRSRCSDPTHPRCYFTSNCLHPHYIKYDSTRLLLYLQNTLLSGRKFQPLNISYSLNDIWCQRDQNE